MSSHLFPSIPIPATLLEMVRDPEAKKRIREVHLHEDPLYAPSLAQGPQNPSVLELGAA